MTQAAYQFRMRAGSSLPSLQVDWYDGTGALVQFASGWTFQVKVAADPDGTALITKTTGITGSNASPSVTVDWTTTELSALTVGTYYVDLKAIRTSDSKVRFFPASLVLVIDKSIA